ncbi:hypothetical protein QF026_000214 [Streptomyces aurantiacus]|nr:hypothetical protein [Streptomyces aurantiacus]
MTVYFVASYFWPWILKIDDIDQQVRTVRIGKRRHLVPLEPAFCTVLQWCLAHREAWRTGNPHVMVTKGTKAGRSPASTACRSHDFDDCGFRFRMIRNTRTCARGLSDQRREP